MKCLEIRNYVVFCSIIILEACSSILASEDTKVAKSVKVNTEANNHVDLVYYNSTHVKLVRDLIKAKDSFFVKNYKKLINKGIAALDFDADPVTNKKEVPPSKNMHDYLSYAPYKWPDTLKKDGLPWVTRDGQINPVFYSSDTDFTRTSTFFDVIDVLSWSYYFSKDKRFAKKAIKLINTWYLNPETKVNPNINFGQRVPGAADGRKAGVQEWCNQSSVITALQIFDADGLLTANVKTGMQFWFEKYLTWLTTNPMAIKAGFTRQNHANHYNYQVVGLMMYLGKNEDAKAVVKAAKQSRIADQITPNGKQPRELGRTRSVHYASLNLWSMTELALMGRKLGIDLWNYETDDFRSLRKAYAYLIPFVVGDKKWEYKEISEGGIEQTVEMELKPMFSKASTSLDTLLVNAKVKTYKNLKPLDVLRYPPKEILDKIELFKK